MTEVSKLNMEKKDHLRGNISFIIYFGINIRLFGYQDDRATKSQICILAEHAILQQEVKGLKEKLVSLKVGIEETLLIENIERKNYSKSNTPTEADHTMKTDN